ncbi:MAG: hypothetical protein ACOYL6_13535 [Bacteriovoracaceae bacterium]
MQQNNNLKITVKLLVILMSIVCTKVQAQLAPVGMEARIVTFFKGDSEKNQNVRNIKASNDAWLLQKEQQQLWNTTPGNIAVNSESNQEKVAIKNMIKSLTSPLNDGLKNSLNNSNATLLETIQDRKLSGKSSIAAKGTASKEEDKVSFNWKIQPEKLRGRLRAQYKSFETEANVQAVGKKELASSHTLSEFGLTTRVSYRFDNQTTVTSLDKNLTEHVVGRISKTIGTLPESRAEVVYSHSF